MRNPFEGRDMYIEPIKTDGDYRRTLAEIEGLMTAERDTPEGDRLDVLVTLVEAWEAQHYSVDPPDPSDSPALMIDTEATGGRENRQDLQSEHRARPQPRERWRC